MQFNTEIAAVGHWTGLIYNNDSFFFLLLLFFLINQAEKGTGVLPCFLSITYLNAQMQWMNIGCFSVIDR